MPALCIKAVSPLSDTAQEWLPTVSCSLSVLQSRAPRCKRRTFTRFVSNDAALLTITHQTETLLVAHISRTFDEFCGSSFVERGIHSSLLNTLLALKKNLVHSQVACLTFLHQSFFCPVIQKIWMTTYLLKGLFLVLVIICYSIFAFVVDTLLQVFV